MAKKNNKATQPKKNATKIVSKSKKAIEKEVEITEQEAAIEQPFLTEEEAIHEEPVVEEKVTVIEEEQPITTYETESITEVTPKLKNKRKQDSEILIGCSYHYFRKFFRKPFINASIKVSFVKEPTGYNGHIAVSLTELENAQQVLQTIQTEHAGVKNLCWNK